MKDKTVYVLQHSYEYGDELQYEETKFIGVYSSNEKAKQAITRLQGQEGFREHSFDCFFIDEYVLDKDHWIEGFSI